MKVVSFRSSDFNVEDRLRTDRPGRDWQVQLREFNISNAVANFRFKDRLNQPGEFNFELLSKPFDPEGGERVFIGRNGELKFSGFTRRPSSSTMREDRYQGVGGAMLLDRESLSESDFDDSDLLGTNTDDFVQMLFDSINIDGVSVGVNTRLNQVNDTVDVRVDDDTALEVLNRIVLSYGGDWYVSFDKESAEFKFNIEDRVESTNVIKTFEGGTDNTNIEDLKDEKIIDEEYDAVFVKGYGDGDDQVKGFYPEKSQWPNNPRVLSYTDKTIISESVAEETAENLFEEHSDWRSISLVPAEKNQPLDLGDKVKIEDENTGINEEFRIVQRKISVDYTDENIIEYVLNDKPVGLLDEVQDVSDITRSQTDYEQGAKNKYTDKQADQADNTAPLRLELHTPFDVEDKTGKNRVKEVNLNYTLKDFRQYVDSDEVKVIKNQSGATQSGEVNENLAGATQSGEISGNETGVSQSGEVNNNNAGATQSGEVLDPQNISEGFEQQADAQEHTSYVSNEELFSSTPGDSDDTGLYTLLSGYALFQFGNDAPEDTLEFQMGVEAERQDGIRQLRSQFQFITVDPSGTGGSSTHVTIPLTLAIPSNYFKPDSLHRVEYSVDGPTDLQRVTVVGSLYIQFQHSHDDDLEVDEPLIGHPHTDSFDVEEPIGGHGHNDSFEVDEPVEGHPHEDDFEVNEPDEGHPHNSEGGDLEINVNDEGRGDEITVVIDGDTENSFTLSGEQRDNIDLLSEYEGNVDLTQPGFYTIDIYPNAASYTIGEVELDYYKNT